MAEDGLSLRKACKAIGVKAKTFLDHCEADPALAQQYARARESLLDHWAEDIAILADDANTANRLEFEKARLRIDSRKWMLSKLRPRKYGDKPESEDQRAEAAIPSSVASYNNELAKLFRKGEG